MMSELSEAGKAVIFNEPIVRREAAKVRKPL